MSGSMENALHASFPCFSQWPHEIGSINNWDYEYPPFAVRKLRLREGSNLPNSYSSQAVEPGVNPSLVALEPNF